MNKKWENPKLESIGVEKTECGAWKYYYICDNCNYSCGSYTPMQDSDCWSCNSGTIKFDHKEWRDEFCEGACS